MKQFLLLVNLLISNILLAQVADNFSDGNFTFDPKWYGDTSKFIVNNSFQLQLNNSAIADEAYLSIPASISDSASWIFYFKMAFSPSATNYLKVYLQSDQEDLKSNLNGYFIKIGENGSNDAINLYEQTGTTEKLIAQGITGKAAINPQFYVKVIRDNIGNWSIYSDTSAGGNFVLEGTGFSDKHRTGNYFGFLCKHTSSNAKKFYFDDVFIDPIFTDTIPPKITGINIKDQFTIEVLFSEAVDSISACETSNYLLSNSIGNPSKISRDNLKIVKLTFQVPLLSKEKYWLTIADVADGSGNLLIKDSIEFFYFRPEFKDIIINEIMADPSPPIDLPEAEYVELFNNSGFPINLKNWKFSDAASTAILPDVVIPADSFIILVSNADIPLFSNYGLVAGVASLPSLNNAGDQLSLLDPDGNLIYSVIYSDKWYRDTKKKDGGWSLEMIDINNKCSEENNWIASADNSGGTPGRVNSVVSFTDSNVIAVNKIIPDYDSLIIEFSKPINTTSVINSQNFHIKNGITVTAANILSNNKILLKLDQPMQHDINYILFVNNIYDCNGKSIDSVKSYNFSLPQKATFFDIVINEIMADPDPAVALPAIEFVELYNRSNKAINLNQWKLSDGKEAVFPEIILEPQSYLILVAAGKESNFIQYGKVLGLPNWPSLNNDEDHLFLFNNKNELIHSLNYSDSWYGSKIKKDGGWSLEMIDPSNPCGGTNNWSASKDHSGGTPGRKNSIFNSNPDKTLPLITGAYAEDANTVVAVFNEPLHPTDIDVKNFHIKNGIGNPNEVQIFTNDHKKVKLSLNQPLVQRIIYELEVSDVKDCAGNSMSKSIIAFGIAEPAAPHDIVINEILYNPDKGGVDFVEIYNNSNKIIDLKDLIIAKALSEEAITDYTLISSVPFLILPDAYYALTQDPEIIKSNYYTPHPENIIYVPKLPNYLDDEGGVALLNKYTEVIDFVYYYSDWQHPLIDDHNGISLEKINFGYKSNDKNSWHSAATKVRATPGYKNSQSAFSSEINANFILEPEVFSPDGDGYNDYLKINYNFEQAGNIVSVSIFNTKGHLIRQLIKNEMTEQSGFLIWDGLNQEMEKVSPGIYIIFIESYNNKGRAFSTKLKCVVGGIL